MTIEQENGNGKWQIIVYDTNGQNPVVYLESELISACPTTAGKWIMKAPAQANVLQTTVTTTEIHTDTQLAENATVPIIVTCSEGNLTTTILNYMI